MSPKPSSPPCRTGAGPGRRPGATRSSGGNSDRLSETLGGRPTPLYFARNLSRRAGGAEIWLKREDLVHGGAHKFNNALGQGLLARRMGKPRLIAETGAGQHGVATAMVGAALGLRTEVYMGAVDMRAAATERASGCGSWGRRSTRSRTGSRTLKDAINAALRDWIANVRTTHYLLGSAVGPHPFPSLVAEFQSVIGREIRRQSFRAFGRLPDLAVACVGGGSNAIGTFHPLIGTDVEFLGVEAGGVGGRSPGAASLSSGTARGSSTGRSPMSFRTRTDKSPRPRASRRGSITPGVGPEHAWLRDRGRAKYIAVQGPRRPAGFPLARRGRRDPAGARALPRDLRGAAERPAGVPGRSTIVVTLSGRGDKDLGVVTGAPR